MSPCTEKLSSVRRSTCLACTEFDCFLRSIFHLDFCHAAFAFYIFFFTTPSCLPHAGYGIDLITPRLCRSCLHHFTLSFSPLRRSGFFFFHHVYRIGTNHSLEVHGASVLV